MRILPSFSFYSVLISQFSINFIEFSNLLSDISYFLSLSLNFFVFVHSVYRQTFVTSAIDRIQTNDRYRFQNTFSSDFHDVTPFLAAFPTQSCIFSSSFCLSFSPVYFRRFFLSRRYCANCTYTKFYCPHKKRFLFIEKTA